MPRATCPRAVHGGPGNDERHPRAALEQALFLPQAVVAEVVPVVAGEDDDGVRRQPKAFERVEHVSHLCVHERSRRVVRLDRLLPLTIGGGVLLGECAAIRGSRRSGSIGL